MDLVDWNDPEHIQWMCEQAGVDFKGLPLPHYDKQKLLAIIERHPPGQVPTFRKRTKEVPVTTQAMPKMDSETAEKTLFSQYNAEIAKARSNQERYARLAREAKEEEKLLLKKSKSLAKILGIPLTGGM